MRKNIIIAILTTLLFCQLAYSYTETQLDRIEKKIDSLNKVLWAYIATYENSGD